MSQISKKTYGIYSPIGIVFSLCLLVVIACIFPKNTAAAPVTGWNAGRIVDDAIMTSKDSMSVAQIQSFIGSKIPSCDTNGQQLSEYGGPDLNGDGKVQRWEWGQANYNQTTFTCLKDYSENGISSAQIIYNAAQKYSINPQVLVVLLQKEQGLVTDTWPLNVQYKTATGYGCPDTAPCDSQYYGLTNQINWSATMFRAILDNSPTWYTPYILGNNYIQWSPNSSCGGSTVNIQNRATQALYNYTPYQPNQAALDAGWGGGDGCSAYGNRNFYLYFTEWFGPTIGPDYAWSLQSADVYANADFSTRIGPGNDGNVVLGTGQKAYVKVVAKNIGRSTWTGPKLGTSVPFDRASPFYDSSWQGPTRTTYASEASVAYNQTTTFAFTINAPSNPGSYFEHYTPVIDGVTWLQNNTFGVRINVVKLRDLDNTNRNTLRSGETLNADELLVSPEGNTVVRLQKDGNLVQYTDFLKVWETNTAGQGGIKVVNQTDGNVVMYDKNGIAVWSTGTGGHGASDLTLQTDANTVLYTQSGGTPLWSTGSGTLDQRSTLTMALGTNFLMHQNQYLQTIDGAYRLTLQRDGNVVISYRGNPVWGSNTYGKNGDLLTLQSDGNLVLYDYAYRPIWDSGSTLQGQHNLYMQDDGNLVKYSNGIPSWSTRTAGKR